MTVTELIENSVPLIWTCDECGELHANPDQLVSYLQWLANEYLITLN